MEGVDEVRVEELPDDVAPPPSRTSLPCAASRARSRIVAGSPLTKWNVLSDKVNDGRSWCRHDEYRSVERRLVAPPALPFVVAPSARSGPNLLDP